MYGIQVLLLAANMLLLSANSWIDVLWVLLAWFVGICCSMLIPFECWLMMSSVFRIFFWIKFRSLCLCRVGAHGALFLAMVIVCSSIGGWM